MIHIYHTRFDNHFPEDHWYRLLQQLPKQMQEKVLRFRKWEDRHRSLLGKLLLKKALPGMGAAIDFLERLQYTRYGRPYLPSGPDFNISHSGNIVVCSCTASCITGIDIEELSAVDFCNFEQMFSASEWDDILQAPERLQRFYHYWTIKESVIKADGRGFSASLEKLVIEGNQATLDDRNWFVQELNIAAGYKCFVASDSPQEITLEEVSFADNPAF